MRVLVTGVYGFIGSYFVKWLLSQTTGVQVIGFARNSDQSYRARLAIPREHEHRLKVVYGDLCNERDVSGICEHVDIVVNFAAKTFVDHSLKDHRPFIESNIIGADNLMTDAARYNVRRFIQVSTDEVYGQILEGAYREDAMLQPRNPYAWSKACADLDAIQRHRTSGFPVIITRTENNFGPWQHRQKALPTFVRCAMSNLLIPIYGDGLHVRCWLHVEEHCRAIHHLFWQGQLGEVYHVAGKDEMTNMDLARFVLATLGKPLDGIRLVPDHNIRPGHDRRYALNCDKIEATGFTIKQDLKERLREAIFWYAEHQEWTR